MNEYWPSAPAVAILENLDAPVTNTCEPGTMASLSSVTRPRMLADWEYAGLASIPPAMRMQNRRKPRFICSDEVGYLNLKPEQSNIFFKLMEERYRQHPTIITTNLNYDEWPNFLGNKSMVDALLSRVRHYCHTVTINGPSLREPQG